jgi:hypothetical protein
MVEAEQKKSAKSKTETETKEPAGKEDVALNQEAKPSEPDADSSTPYIESEEAGKVQSRKRGREEENGDDEGVPEAKKVDTKTEPVVTNGRS